MSCTTRRSLLKLVALSLPEGFSGRASGGTIVRSKRPEDIEMALDGFAAWITPTEDFFTRSHHYTPSVNAAEWRLEIAGLVDRSVKLSLEELRRRPRHELVGVLECAGNGRGLYQPRVPGIQWEYGGVGNAKWTGVRLVELLRQAGVKEAARDVLFDGADVPVGTMPEFRRSIPLEKALDPDTILAYEMNGRPLPEAPGGAGLGRGFLGEMGDADRGSRSRVRRFLHEDRLPASGAAGGSGLGGEPGRDAPGDGATCEISDIEPGPRRPNRTGTDGDPRGGLGWGDSRHRRGCVG
jgi:hypothetical protein